MEESKQNMSLGDVLNAMNNGSIGDGDILRNASTDERVLVHNGDLSYLTFNDYISNVVPLVNGMIDTKWTLEESGQLEVTPQKAVEILSNGRSVSVSKGSESHTVPDTEELFFVLNLLGIEDVVYKALRADVEHVNELKELEEAESKSRGRTSESEAWAMLMDRHLFDKPVKEIADKFGTSLRNAYYIIDGTYYPEVFERFNQLVETGELYIVKNSDK